jgi:RNA polymerase sigma-70 factor, ECF subfamily
MLAAAVGGRCIRSRTSARGGLTAAVATGALDALRPARARREVYVGPWLLEPVVEDAPADQDPADRAALDDTVSVALLAVLETLTPAERTAWALHDLSGMSFAETPGAAGRPPKPSASLPPAHASALARRASMPVQPGMTRR